MYDPAIYKKELTRCARRIGVPAYWLDAIIISESRRNPRAANPLPTPETGGVGLIQFMPFTLTGLGLTRQQVLNATAAQHFDYVARYFEAQYKAFGIVPGRDLKDPVKLYNVVFYPKAVREGLYIRRGTKAYDWNKGLDNDHDGVITDADMARHIAPRLKEAQAFLGASSTARPSANGSGTVLLIAAAGAGLLLLATSKKAATVPSEVPDESITYKRIAA